MDRVDLVLRLTLLDLLWRPIGNWALRPVILLLAAIGLVFPNQLRRPGLWAMLTVLTGLRVVLDWPLPDNHAYLLCYWCLAISLVLVSRDPQACLAINGRVLIGGVFAFATLWKLVLSSDYLDGGFFCVMLLTDPRFEGFTQLFGGLAVDDLEAFRAFLAQHVDGPLFDRQALPQLPGRFVQLAQLATWWTLVLESSIAVTFLRPWRHRLSPLVSLRDIFLILFCLTTYAVAPVEGFGWLLVAMGLAQSEAETPWLRFGYLATFATILCYREIPWAGLILDVIAQEGSSFS